MSNSDWRNAKSTDAANECLPGTGVNLVRMLDLHGWGMAAGPCQIDCHDHHCWGLVWDGAGRPPAALQMPVCHLLQWSAISTHPVRHMFTPFAAKLVFHCEYSQMHLRFPQRSRRSD